MRNQRGVHRRQTSAPLLGLAVLGLAVPGLCSGGTPARAATPQVDHCVDRVVGFSAAGRTVAIERLCTRRSCPPRTRPWTGSGNCPGQYGLPVGHRVVRFDLPRGTARILCDLSRPSGSRPPPGPRCDRLLRSLGLRYPAVTSSPVIGHWSLRWGHGSLDQGLSRWTVSVRGRLPGARPPMEATALSLLSCLPARGRGPRGAQVVRILVLPPRGPAETFRVKAAPAPYRACIEERLRKIRRPWLPPGAHPTLITVVFERSGPGRLQTGARNR
jgi:hypothetical protein